MGGCVPLGRGPGEDRTRRLRGARVDLTIVDLTNKPARAPSPRPGSAPLQVGSDRKPETPDPEPREMGNGLQRRIFIFAPHRCFHVPIRLLHHAPPTHPQRLTPRPSPPEQGPSVPKRRRGKMATSPSLRRMLAQPPGMS